MKRYLIAFLLCAAIGAPALANGGRRLDRLSLHRK